MRVYGNTLEDVHLIAPRWRNRYDDERDPDCWHCGAVRETSGRMRDFANLGLCARCYKRWSDHGFAGCAPPAVDRHAGGWQWYDDLLLDEFAERDRPGVTGASAELARYFGVTRRTLTRWRRIVAARKRRGRLLKIAAEVAGRDRWRSRLRESRPRDVCPLSALVAAESHLDPAPVGVARRACLRA